MCQDPLKQFLKPNLSRSKSEKNIGQLFLGIFQLSPIKREKHQHSMCTDPLIAIHKGMVLHQGETQSRRFLL